MPEDNSPAAFPKAGASDASAQSGMSLRNWFAGKALQGLAAGSTTAATTAATAYALADAMLVKMVE